MERSTSRSPSRPITLKCLTRMLSAQKCHLTLLLRNRAIISVTWAPTDLPVCTPRRENGSTGSRAYLSTLKLSSTLIPPLLHLSFFPSHPSLYASTKTSPCDDDLRRLLLCCGACREETRRQCASYSLASSFTNTLVLCRQLFFSTPFTSSPSVRSPSLPPCVCSVPYFGAYSRGEKDIMNLDLTSHVFILLFPQISPRRLSRPHLCVLLKIASRWDMDVRLHLLFCTPAYLVYPFFFFCPPGCSFVEVSGGLCLYYCC
jgi:hypothetical protein